MKADKHYVYVILLASMITTTASALSALGERRLDVYFSMYVLEYFVAGALMRPRRLTRDYLGFILFALFVLIVARRISMVLGIPFPPVFMA